MSKNTGICHEMEIYRRRLVSQSKEMMALVAASVETSRKLGATARAKRELMGKSLGGVARKMGVSKMYLSDLERGNRGWSSYLLDRFNQALAALLVILLLVTGCGGAHVANVPPPSNPFYAKP